MELFEPHPDRTRRYGDPHPVDQWSARIAKCKTELMLADYIESTTRRALDVKFWTECLDAQWIDHDGSGWCPVLPGTRILARLTDGGELTARAPQRLNWSMVKQWKPLT
jgi:hypothetical protein